MPFLKNPTDHDLVLSNDLRIDAGQQIKVTAADAAAYVGHPILELIEDAPKATKKAAAATSEEPS